MRIRWYHIVGGIVSLGIIGGGLYLILRRKPVSPVPPSPPSPTPTPPSPFRLFPTPTTPPPPPSPTENPLSPQVPPDTAQRIRQHYPVDYSPVIKMLEERGFVVIAKEETLAYGRGEISPTEYIDIWIREAKEAGYTVPAEKELRDLYTGTITYEEYREAYIREVKPPDWYIELWDKYVAGLLTYDQYIAEYLRMVGR